jgi:hypothetical protein
MVFGLPMTGIELFEHVARGMYATQLLFTPASWLAENFVAGAAASGPLIWMTRLGGLFLFCVKGAALNIQYNGNEKSRKLMMLTAGATWGSCLLLTLPSMELFKTPAVYINLGLQVFFALGFLYSAMTYKAPFSPEIRPKRIVTGSDPKTGKSIVMPYSGPMAHPTNAPMPGWWEFWLQDDNNVIKTQSGDTIDLNAGINVGPKGKNGSVFRYWTVMESKPPSEKSEAEALEEYKFWKDLAPKVGMGDEWTGTPLAACHATNTIDYIVVLGKGGCWLQLDDEAIKLNQYDVVIDRGVNHFWYVLPGEEPCLNMACLLAGTPSGAKPVSDYAKEHPFKNK